MDRVSVRYSHDTDTVLRDISLDFKAGQKVKRCRAWLGNPADLTLDGSEVHTRRAD